MAPIARRLVELGHGTRFVRFTDRADRYDDLLDGPTIDLDPTTPPDDIPSFDAVFLMNDWGVETQGFVRLARWRGAVSIARVEGVQDFDDVDTHRSEWPWVRNPYQSADLVLAQGPNDVRSLARRTGVVVVGNPRLEPLLRAEPRPDQPGRIALINSNFTYGVFTDARRQFLLDAVEATRAAGLRPMISKHPADGRTPPRLEKFVTETPMSEALRTAAVLVSRFSTVPFEALAQGTPFVYFNPHGERVPTFTRPNGAFDSATDADGLAEALRAAAALEPGETRSRAQGFLAQQIEVTTTGAVDRTVAAILTSVSGAR